MNNEIKAILDRLKDSVDYPIINVPTFDGSDEEPMDNCQCLTPSDCKLLLDYITNLQQENERLNKRVKECEEAYLRTRHQYSELENKYLTDEHIINELEKWLCEEQAIYRDYLIREPKIASDYGERSLTLFNLTKVLDKLQALKGGSSNE